MKKFIDLFCLSVWLFLYSPSCLPVCLFDDINTQITVKYEHCLRVHYRLFYIKNNQHEVYSCYTGKQKIKQNWQWILNFLRRFVEEQYILHSDQMQEYTSTAFLNFAASWVFLQNRNVNKRWMTGRQTDRLINWQTDS